MRLKGVRSKVKRTCTSPVLARSAHTCRESCLHTHVLHDLHSANQQMLQIAPCCFCHVQWLPMPDWKHGNSPCDTSSLLHCSDNMRRLQGSHICSSSSSRLFKTSRNALCSDRCQPARHALADKMIHSYAGHALLVRPAAG